MLHGDVGSIHLEPDQAWSHDKWEHLWLGNMEEGAGSRMPTYATYEDSTVVNMKKEQSFVKKVFEEYGIGRGVNASETLRIIKRPDSIWGAQAYALSRRGAEKLLYNYAHTANIV